MLEALPSAQSSGQKAQEDAQLGQGSIFDFGDAGDSEGPPAGQAHHRPPISAEEFERAELLALEKETLGTYLSSHPLTEVRGALRARVDCSLADLANKQDGSWVTVGGIVTECKKIRTKSGSQMMFATLDDVEGQVELLVFKADQAESAAVIAPDAIVVVRGRLDHKDRGETKLVVQEAERFEPDAAEIAAAPAVASVPSGPFEVLIEAAMYSQGLLDELKSVLEHHKGDTEVHFVVRSAGETTLLECGEGYRVRPSGRLRSELDHVLESATALAA
jgi:DNA polymerase-3 subunit alpha